MTVFFECVEMSRPRAAVARNTAGSNGVLAADLRLAVRLVGLDLGVRDITASPPFRRELKGLSATNAWHKAAVGDALMYASGHSRPR
jgi:hypothetical protein